MSQNPAVVLNPEPPDDVSALSTDDLIARLRRSILACAEQYLFMARCVAALDVRGVDPCESGLSPSMVSHLRRVQSGHLLPAVLAKFGHAGDRVVKKIERLPVQQQQQLVDDGRVKLAVVRPDGSSTHQMLDLAKVTNREAALVSQVLADDHVRTEEEQRVYLAGLQAREAAKRPARTNDQVGNMVLDKERRGAVTLAKDVFCPLTDLKEVVRRLER